MSRTATLSLEIGAALPSQKPRHQQRHLPRSARTGPRRRNSPSHLDPVLRDRSLARSPVPWLQAAREVARELRRLKPVWHAHLMLGFRLLDDPGCCRSRHDSLRACCVARCDDDSMNALFRPKLPQVCSFGLTTSHFSWSVKALLHRRLHRRHHQTRD